MRRNPKDRKEYSQCIIACKEKRMPQKQMMTIHEKLAIAKEFIGVDFLMQGGFNLSEAEAEFGPGWLAQ
jgi:hypothetical protein